MKNWLAPIFTGLAVLALALLPQRLSVLQDQKLTGAVHAEELAADSNFPAKPPELPGRIWLLAQWMDGSENLAVVGQELADDAGESAKTLAMAREAVAALKESGAVPREVPLEDIQAFDGQRLYLRDRSSLSSAEFLTLESADKRVGAHLFLILDGETGQVLHIRLNYPAVSNYADTAASAGRALLDGLGAWTELLADEWLYAVFRLPDCRALYYAVLERNSLTIAPGIDWEAVESSADGEYRGDLPGISVDG